MRPSQLARRLDVSPDVVYAWIRRGVLPADCIERDGRHIFISIAKFTKFAESGGLEGSYLLRRQVPVLDEASRALEQITAFLNELR
jgi:transposase-like protein